MQQQYSEGTTAAENRRESIIQLPTTPTPTLSSIINSIVVGSSNGNGANSLSHQSQQPFHPSSSSSSSPLSSSLVGDRYIAAAATSNNESSTELTAADDDSELVLFQTLKGSALVLLVLWTIAANSLVFVVLYKNPRLQTVPNLLVGNLAFSDICLSLLVLPFSTVYAIGNQWYFGRYFCEVWLSGDILCCTASIWNMSTIGLDRYWAITSPVTYMNKRNKRTAFTMIGLVWLLSIMVSLAPFLGWRAAANRGNHVLDPVTNTTQCMFMDLPAYTIYSATGSFFVPSILMFFVYYKIYMAFADHRARQIYRQKVIRRHIESTILHEISRVLPTSDEFAQSDDDDDDDDDDEDEDDDDDDDDYEIRSQVQRTIIQNEAGDGSVAKNGFGGAGRHYAACGGGKNQIRVPSAEAIIEEDEAEIEAEEEAQEQAETEKEKQEPNDVMEIETEINSKKNSTASIKRDGGIPPVLLGSRGLFSKRGFQPEPDPMSSTSSLTAVDSAAVDKSLIVKDCSDVCKKGVKTPSNRSSLKTNPGDGLHASTEELESGQKQNRNSRRAPSKSPNQVRRVNLRGKPLTFERVQRHKNRAERRAMLRKSLQNKPPAISASKEKRGVKVLGIILGCFTVCWTPFFVSLFRIFDVLMYYFYFFMYC